jgi:hypothetical protein
MTRALIDGLVKYTVAQHPAVLIGRAGDRQRATITGPLSCR